ncbi:hypothetical protein F5B20DRAFT_198288 [Whalleya microplaca]|nr:hypothetical protein F5B20DRAFT_198288 [Whalleya microplaca]
MPTIDGIKMACVPCIRGHRSTKCSHAHERVMIPVRRPGRPLSTCPHPPGSTCTCRGVTAAIPRKGKCGCGSAPNQTNGTLTPIESDSSIVEKSPISPTKDTTFRVQKSAGKDRSRKQSSDADALVRMDINHFNIVSPPGFTMNMENGMGPIDPSAASSYTSLQQPGLEQRGPLIPHLGYQSASPALDTTTNALLAPISSIADFSPASSSREKISGRSSIGSDTSSAYHTPTSSSADSPSYDLPSEEFVPSCCQRRPSQLQTGAQVRVQPQAQPQAESRKPTTMMGLGHQVSPSHSVMIPQYPPSAGLNQQIYPPYCQPTIYTYPANYGTAYQPLEISQWQNIANSMHSMQNPYAMQSGIDSNGSVTTHICDCGEGCQCVGCIAHPFNDASWNLVRKIISGEELSTMDSESHAETIPETNGAVHDPVLAQSGPPPAVGGASPSSAHTPSDTGLVVDTDEEKVCEASEYFFVLYREDGNQMGCGGMSNRCPCGNDCQCVGCMMHGNPANSTPV